jgi:hypothetical protein
VKQSETSGIQGQQPVLDKALVNNLATSCGVSTAERSKDLSVNSLDVEQESHNSFDCFCDEKSTDRPPISSINSLVRKTNSRYMKHRAPTTNKWRSNNIMPLVDKKSPFCAVWDSFAPDGEPVERELYPEQLLPFMTRGFSPDEIASALDAPIEAVEHAIMKIPEMMVWRRQQLKHTYLQDPEKQKLSLPQPPPEQQTQYPETPQQQNTHRISQQTEQLELLPNEQRDSEP